MAPRLAEVDANTSLACEEIRAAAAEGASLVVLPEAALTGYVFPTRETALSAAVEAGGPALRAVERVCGAVGVHCVVGAIEREGGTLYNSLFLLGPGGREGRYRKTHTLCLGVDRFTTPGDRLRVFDLPFGCVGLTICYDGTFPETARALKLLGAQLILLPTNWPTLRMRREQVCVRAWENHVNYFAVNRVGTEGGVEFRGGSVAADPKGDLLTVGGDGPERLHVEFDLAAADETYVVVSEGEYEFDYVADRRPELYEPLVRSRSDGPRTGSRRA